MPARPARRGVSGFRQAWVLVRRYLSIWRGDRQALLAMLGQSLAVAVLLGLVFGNLGDVSNPAERVARTVNLLLAVGRVVLLVRVQHGGERAGEGARDFPPRAGLQPARGQLLRLEVPGTGPDRRGPGDAAVHDRPAVVPAARARRLSSG